MGSPLKKRTFLIVLSLMVLLPASRMAVGESVSDIAKDNFEKGPSALTPLPRSPFVPSYQTGEDVDVATLLVQGLVYGKKFRMAMLSGRIVREGEKIGKYTVETIFPDKVALTDQNVHQTLKVENYVAPLSDVVGEGYAIEFRNAALRDALRFLAKIANLNIILPEDLSGRVTLSFHEMDLMEALRSLLRVNGYEYALEEGIVRVGKPEAFLGNTDLRTQNYRLKYATAKDMVDRVKPLLSDRGAVVADDRTNTLTVKDRDAIIESIGHTVALVDRRDRQVLIEARIVDASKNFSRDIGIRWGMSGQKGNVQVGGTADVGNSSDTTNPLNVNLGAGNPTSGIGLIIGSIAGALNIQTQLTMAEEKGDIEILAKPSVTTLNNMPAKIRSGTKIYVKSTSSINVGTAGGSASAGSAALQEIETGITLTVQPQISDDDFIKMKIDAVESEADFSRTVDGIPAVIDNYATTTVILRDGETTVIGGLSKQRKSKLKRGVPGLYQVPVLGHLFQSKSKQDSGSELLIFITPRLVKS
jgi:type IV pilus assembly protein PilQ